MTIWVFEDPWSSLTDILFRNIFYHTGLNTTVRWFKLFSSRPSFLLTTSQCFIIQLPVWLCVSLIIPSVFHSPCVAAWKLYHLLRLDTLITGAETNKCAQGSRDRWGFGNMEHIQRKRLRPVTMEISVSETPSRRSLSSEQIVCKWVCTSHSGLFDTSLREMS